MRLTRGQDVSVRVCGRCVWPRIVIPMDVLELKLVSGPSAILAMHLLFSALSKVVG